MGSPYHDALIADAAAVPVDLAGFYSEALLYVSPVFSAATHAVSHPDVPYLAPASRRDAGLPDDPSVFVFACFNSLYKITPSLFGVWLSILKKVPRSVLWMLEPGGQASPEGADATDEGGELAHKIKTKKGPARSAAADNLCRMARAKGVSCSRLVFTAKVPLAHHLQTKANAGLFLDTVLYNAHSTAADALWAGIPVLTMAREKMASRVGASLALSLGMPELVARTLGEYEQLAVRLASSPRTLAHLRRALVVRRTQAVNAVNQAARLEEPAQKQNSTQRLRARCGGAGVRGGGGRGGADTGGVGAFDVQGWMDCYERLLPMALEGWGRASGAAAAEAAGLPPRVRAGGLRSFHVIVA